MDGPQIQDLSQQHGTASPAQTPQASRHPMAWRPEDFVETTNSSVIVVDQVGRTEVAQALESFKAHGLDGDEVCRENFPLPSLASHLDDRASPNVHEGTGFAVIRGLDLSSFRPEDQLVIFLGLASYMGNVRGMQDRRGTMIAHITDSKLWSGVAPRLRHGIHTNSDLSWHNDMGVDILALHVRAVAEQGGRTFLASSWTIYQELERTRPDIIHILTQSEWPIQVSGNPPRFLRAPLLQVYKGKILFSVDPGRLGVHPGTSKHARTPPGTGLTDAQHEALDVVSDLATKNRYCLNTIPGDMIFINNWSLLHARESYKDSDSDTNPNQRRHLVRLWLRNSKRAWDIPPCMRAPWEAAYGPHGDGNPVHTAGIQRFEVERQYPVVPGPVYKIPKYTAGSAAFILEDDSDVNAFQGSSTQTVEA
ncbi:hypothetical protein QBC39DRAFT_249580 [Podospora conica]|nr:hypothetical protein QBC39DRAFT_249580 [Schizothecium conicum]